MMVAFGNAIIHDITLSKQHQPKEDWDIKVYGDDVMGEKIPMYRTSWVEIDGVREQING